MILIYLCGLKEWKSELIECKNSEYIIGDKSSVISYASFVF